MEGYRRQGEVHVQKDEEVTWETVTDAQKILKGHVYALNKVFNLGENQGEKQFRVCEAKMLNHTSIPNLSIMPKDHKELDPITGEPATRPVCGASVSPNGELSHFSVTYWMHENKGGNIIRRHVGQD